MNGAKSHTEGMEERAGSLENTAFIASLFSVSVKKKVHDCFCDSGFSIFLLTSVRIESVGGIKG